MTVTITPEPADSDLARSLVDRYFAELAERFPDGFDAGGSVSAPTGELVPPHGAFLVVRIDDRPAGCGAVRRLDAATAEIKHMWIDPAARGRGAARTLLAGLESTAVDLGCSRVRLDTNGVLTEAIALYRSAGYVDVPRYNNNAYAEHWFEKAICSTGRPPA